MKKTGVFITFLLLLLALSSAYAEVKKGSFSVTPFAGFYMFEGNEDLKESYNVGLRAGYNITESIGLEGFAHYVPTDTKEGDADVNLYSYGLEGLYHFMPDSNLVPFIAIGVGGIHYSTVFEQTDKLSVDYGAGVKYFVTDGIAIRADVRHVLPLDDNYNNLLVSLGVNFAFGGEKKEITETRYEEPASPAIITDTDKDGVQDNLDKCPGTPVGQTVGNDGCALDSDADGIADYLDKCPGTPGGIAVDKDGCPLDSDADGIIDYLDKCPGTPAGAVVDNNGCAPAPPPVAPVPAPVVPEEKPKMEIRQKISMTLNVEFDTAKAVVKKKYNDEIKKVADFMKDHPDATAVIEGHTDNVDIYNDPQRNIKLSQARADSIRQYLIDKFGVDASRISAIGHGPNKPIAGNDTSEGRKKNRRVEAVIEADEIKMIE